MNNNFIKKRVLLYGLFLFIMPSYGGLYAAKSAYQPSAQIQKADGVVGLPRAKRKLLVHGYCRAYNIPTGLFLLFIYFVQDDPLQYKNKPLPDDLAEQDLSGYDFTGCSFTYTNLTDTNLARVILTNTICDYQKAFQYNIKKNKRSGGNWYQGSLSNDLKSIAEVYPKLNNNTHKAKMLQVSCGLSRLPFYKKMEFYIKLQYWSCVLLQLKQTIDNPYGQQLVCSLQSDLEKYKNNYCWKTNYLKDRVDIGTVVSHASFDIYLKDFMNGLTKYQCSSISSSGFNWCKDNIIENIKGLKRTYPNIRSKQLQQVACNIGNALSKSYERQHFSLLCHYLFYQDRLIQLKKSVGKETGSEIHYSFLI